MVITVFDVLTSVGAYFVGLYAYVFFHNAVLTTMLGWAPIGNRNEDGGEFFCSLIGWWLALAVALAALLLLTPYRLFKRVYQLGTATGSRLEEVADHYLNGAPRR